MNLENPKYDFRELRPEDIDEATSVAMAGLMRLLERPEASRGYLLGAVENESTHVFVASSSDILVATVTLNILPTPKGVKGYIDEVVTDEEFRGQGISTKLLSLAEEKAKEAGCSYVDLTSSPKREIAISMYEKRGYERRDTGVFRLEF